MVLCISVTPLKDDLISPNWIISYVRAGVWCMFLCLIAPGLGLSSTMDSSHTLDLTCEIHYSSSGLRETEIPLLNPLPFSGLSGSPREEGGFNLTADTYKMLILGFQLFQEPNPRQGFS